MLIKVSEFVVENMGLFGKAKQANKVTVIATGIKTSRRAAGEGGMLSCASVSKMEMRRADRKIWGLCRLNQAKPC